MIPAPPASAVRAINTALIGVAIVISTCVGDERAGNECESARQCFWGEQCVNGRCVSLDDLGETESTDGTEFYSNDTEI